MVIAALAVTLIINANNVLMLIPVLYAQLAIIRHHAKPARPAIINLMLLLLLVLPARPLFHTAQIAPVIHFVTPAPQVILEMFVRSV